MDNKRFNELTKALASGQSRRGVAKGLAAGLVGGLIGFARGGKASARRTLTPPGSICRENSDCAEPGQCLYDQRTRRYRCGCIDPFCLQGCLNQCVDFNQTFNQGVNQTEDCQEFCSQQCLNFTCQILD
jgi:hypothetical protein